jgi:putative drug exporter of the RND superfamily
MATYLYRLGAWAFTNRRKVLGIWVLVLTTVAVCAVTFKGQTNNKFEVPGTESQRAQDLLHEKFPGTGGASARIVFVAPAGEKLSDAENRKAIEATMARARKADEVSSVIDPFEAHALTADRRVGYGDVIYPVPADQIGDRAKDELAEVAAPARAAGLTVEFGNGIVSESKEANSEGTGMLIAYLVLAVTLGSLLAAGLPLVTAIMGVAIGVVGLTALSGVVEQSETAPILATMLGLAVGIDYALFILSRHRQNIADGLGVKEAAARATATAGSAVVFAGLTVVIALVGLTVVNIPFLTIMGLAAAGTVSIAVLIALTLLPALLGFAGDRIHRVNRVLGYRPRGRREATAANMGTCWARFVTARPLLVVLTGLIVLGAIAVPATHMRLGLPDGGSKSTSTTERRAYDQLTESFGPGFNGPLTVVVDAPHLTSGQQRALANAVSDGLETFPGVAAVSEPMQNDSGEVTIVSVTPTTSPASEETKELVQHLRTKADEVEAKTGIQAFVTGTTALNIDTADQLSAALPKYIAIVVGLALLLLTVVFRSILVPIKAALGFMLSIAASLGLVVWVFQDGHLSGLFNVANPSPVVSFVPILLIGILFGLAMDYEVFLVSRMRESFVHSGRAKESIVTGFGHSGRVVTAAALIMIGVFGGFVLDDDPIVKPIGLSLAFGVLVDAFVVRMTLVPAVMALLGKWAWWLPRRLDRRLPGVDIEGEKLLAYLEGAPARP